MEWSVPFRLKTVKFFTLFQFRPGSSRCSTFAMGDFKALADPLGVGIASGPDLGVYPVEAFGQRHAHGFDSEQ